MQQRAWCPTGKVFQAQPERAVEAEITNMMHLSRAIDRARLLVERKHKKSTTMVYQSHKLGKRKRCIEYQKWLYTQRKSRIGQYNNSAFVGAFAVGAMCNSQPITDSFSARLSELNESFIIRHWIPFDLFAPFFLALDTNFKYDCRCKCIQKSGNEIISNPIGTDNRRRMMRFEKIKLE